MDRTKGLFALLVIGGLWFLSSRAKAADDSLAPMTSPLIPGTGGATAPNPSAAPGGGMAPSKAAVDLLKKYVGFSPLPRKEASGAVIIGYGHKVVAGDPAGWADLTLKTPLTPEQGEAVFLNDLLKHVEVINRLVSVPLNQNQYDALALLVFNIGVENFAKSTLLTRLNAKDYASAADQFLVWNKSRDANNNLVVNDGLTARRQGERTLFLTPVVEVKGAVPPTLPTGIPDMTVASAGGITWGKPATVMTREQHLAAGHKSVNLNTSGTRTYIEGWVDANGNPV